MGFVHNPADGLKDFLLDFPACRQYNKTVASVLEQADNRDLKSCALWACGFDPRHSHSDAAESRLFC